MSVNDKKISLNDLYVYSQTIYGETYRQPEIREAIAHLILNRWKQSPDMVLGQICLKLPCWDVEHKVKMMKDVNIGQAVRFRDCMRTALSAIDGGPDPSNGATAFHAINNTWPEWSRNPKPCAKVGHYLFYKLEGVNAN